MLSDTPIITVTGSPWDKVHYAGPGRRPGSWVLRCSGRTVQFAMPGTGPREGYSVWCGNCVKRFGLPGQIPQRIVDQCNANHEAYERRQRGER